MEKHILIIEDEADIASALSLRLRNEGFLVSVADNGIDGLDLAINEDYDLAIIDIMLPGVNGLEITSQLKKKKNTDILILSALDHEGDVVNGLTLGADDYVTKPFSAREIVARVHALMRRHNQSVTPKTVGEHIFGDLTIHTKSHSVTLKDNFVHTTPTEFKILSTLSTNPGNVFSREDLVNALDDTQNVDQISPAHLRTIDSHIRSLRKKIGHGYIRTVHAVGYAFDPDLSKEKIGA